MNEAEKRQEVEALFRDAERPPPAPANGTVGQVRALLEGEAPEVFQREGEAPVEPPVREGVAPAESADAPATDDTDSSDPETAAGPEPEQARPQTLADAAKQLGVEVAELYALAVDLGGERGTATLSELKDAYQDLAEREDDREQLAADRTEYEAQRYESDLTQLRARREFEALVRLGEQAGLLTPALMGHVREQRETYQRKEHAAMLEALPELREPGKFKEARERYLGTAEAYGFSRAEFDEITDHRVIRALHDLSSLRESRSRAKEELAERRQEAERARTTSSRGQARQDARPRTTPRRGGARDKQRNMVSQVAALISE